MTLHAILLVGGRGTRLQPLTDTRPKPMLPIVDEPFLAHQLAWLRRHGVSDVTFACGFLPQAILSYFGDGASVGLNLHYVIEPEPLGTGGAIGFAARTVGRSRVIVCNGDVLTDMDLGALIAFHEQHGAVGTISLTPVEDPSRYGLVRTDSDGVVLAFLEKPTPDQIDTNLINAGTYVLEPELIDRIPEQGTCNIEREIFPQFADGNGLYALADAGYWRDIGTVPSFLAATRDLLAGTISGAGVAGSSDSGGSARTFIDSAASMSADAIVRSPVWIGPGARVEAGATVGPGASVGAGAVLAAGSRVVRSVVMERAVIERDAQVVDSIVGEDGRLDRACSVSDEAVVAPGETVSTKVVRGEART